MQAKFSRKHRNSGSMGAGRSRSLERVPLPGANAKKRPQGHAPVIPQLGQVCAVPKVVQSTCLDICAHRREYSENPFGCWYCRWLGYRQYQ